MVKKPGFLEKPGFWDTRQMEVSLPETIVETNVNYAMEINGKFVIIENVPARVCVETGEQLFSPETVERLQEIIGTEKLA